MHKKRVIPCLDVKDGRVGKGVRFLNLKDAGDPAEIAAVYSREGADELVFLDINASADNRATQLEWVRQVAARVFIPFTVGGGVRTVEDFRVILREGADKIAVWWWPLTRRKGRMRAAGIFIKTAGVWIWASTP